MKNLILGILLLCIAFPAAPSDAADARFNVATYNIRQINDGDNRRGDGWATRRDIVAQLIRFHEFDIFGTQEGFKSQLSDLLERLPGYAYTGVARDDGKEAGEHSAIFYNTAKFELLDHGDFWLAEDPAKPALGWDAACVRICSWGTFRHKESGRDFRFFNLHLDHVGVKARVESGQLVLQKMSEFGDSLPTFLTGDFNVDQTHDVYAVLSGSPALADAFTTAELVYALNGTFNNYRTDGYTTSRIDHIFTSPQVVVEKYGVLTDSYRTPDAPAVIDKNDAPAEITIKSYRTRLPSDHFPVMIRVVLKQPLK